MDRIDIHLEVPPVPFRDLSGLSGGQTSSETLERVMRARKAQEERFRSLNIHANSGMSSRLIRRFCVLDDESNDLLEKAMEKLGLTARAHSRTLKISRTIADLEGATDIRPHHVAEAIQYRGLDRKLIL